MKDLKSDSSSTNHSNYRTYHDDGYVSYDSNTDKSNCKNTSQNSKIDTDINVGRDQLLEKIHKESANDERFYKVERYDKIIHRITAEFLGTVSSFRRINGLQPWNYLVPGYFKAI